MQFGEQHMLEQLRQLLHERLVLYEHCLTLGCVIAGSILSGCSLMRIPSIQVSFTEHTALTTTAAAKAAQGTSCPYQPV
jgi:hypothetical protein